MRLPTELPDDPALPGLVAIRASGLAGAIPALGLEGCPVQLELRRYHPACRATLEARAGNRRLAVKAYAEDPAHEARLYQALASAGLAGDSKVRAPSLLAWEQDLRVLVIGWLEGPTAQQLVESGRGRRAGELAASWLRHAASLSVKFGPPFGALRRLEQARKWAAVLNAVDSSLGTAATRLVGVLTRTQPKEGAPGIVHGSLYAHHVLDLSDGPGLIDWQKSGQGPAELDAGIFLATLWRLGVLQDRLAGEVARAEEVFLAETEGLLEKPALHLAATLLRLAKKFALRQSDGDRLARARALLGRAARCAEAAGQEVSRHAFTR